MQAHWFLMQYFLHHLTMKTLSLKKYFTLEKGSKCFFRTIYLYSAVFLLTLGYIEHISLQRLFRRTVEKGLFSPKSFVLD